MPFTKIYTFLNEEYLNDFKDFSKILRENYCEIVKITKIKNINNNNPTDGKQTYCVSFILNEDITNDMFKTIYEDINMLLGVNNLYQTYYYKNGKEECGVKYTYTNKKPKPVENEKLEFVEDE